MHFWNYGISCKHLHTIEPCVIFCDTIAFLQETDMGKRSSKPDLKSISAKMSQNPKKRSIIRTSYHVFPFLGKTVNPKERAAVSPCCYGEPVTLLDSLFLTEEHPDLGICCCSGHSEKHACDIAAREREGSFSIQVDSPTELWQSGGTSLGLNDTCEVYHQSPEKNVLIQSVFTMPLLSVFNRSSDLFNSV